VKAKTRTLHAAAVAFLAWFEKFEGPQLWAEVNEPGACPTLAALQAAIAATAPLPPKPPRVRVSIDALLRAHPRPAKYGAPMGASNRYDAAPGARLYCQRVRFVDGDYGPDGTYWGSGGAPLYAVFSADLETLAYYRATSRSDAAAQHERITRTRAAAVDSFKRIA
jgi:hypothetical protein